MSGSASTQKISLSLPQALAKRLNAQVPARQRSLFITKILEDYLAVAEQEALLEETAGCWSDEHHPELAAGAEIDAWLAALRGEW
ncbi:MAG: hypothetical protein U0401_30585 [Anaerolineae bacterium]